MTSDSTQQPPAGSSPGPLPANAALDVSSIPGLSEREAEERLRRDGWNEIPSARKRSIVSIAFAVAREPMFLLLVACGTIYLTMGSVTEALLLLGFVFVVMGISLYQERKTERALEALRDLSSPRALVIRGGARRRIAGREVVRDDVLVLVEGDRVPADAGLLACSNLTADESLLTGESVPVRKRAAAPGGAAAGRPGGDDQPWVYSGTLIVQGKGMARVTSTGLHTEMGRIGKALQSVEHEDTPLQKETGRLVRTFALGGISLCAVVVLVYGVTRADWRGGFLAGITLAMATLPEEFPVVLTIFLALGAWRMSRERVLTRRIPAVETLGSATVLCVDKTGTLTLNRMSVKKIFVNDSFYEMSFEPGSRLPEACHQVVEFSILASQRDPFDPMEKAFKELGEHYLSSTEHLHDDWSPVHQYPLSENLLAVSHVWKSVDGRDYVIAAKGAPEAIFDLCHLGSTRVQELARHIDTMAAEGLRVLGVAKAQFRQTELPGEQHEFKFEFLGLVGLADPVRPTVPAAISECHAAGIRVVMITGDYPATAMSIARQIGLARPDQCITGPELDSMQDAELQERAKAVNVFARVVPEQKLRLVNALKADGQVVAMTGDGVNDAPALKAANIGIAMGGRGTDVARESSSLVLLDDDFSSIVYAVRMGRRIFDNIKKAMAYILAIHVPIAGMSLLPVLLKKPLVLLPVHIVFLELIIDPACSVVFEAERSEPDVMRRRPRDPKEKLFSGKAIAVSLLQGFSVLGIVLLVYSVAIHRAQHMPRPAAGEDEARALAFITLLFANLGLILTNRSWSQTVLGTLRSPNRALWYVLGGAMAVLGLVLYVPPITRLFSFARLHAADVAICLGAALLSVVWFELVKLFNVMRSAPE